MGFGAALYGGETTGQDIYAKMQAMARMKAAQQGRADLVNAMLQQGQPTAMNPPPGQPSQPAQPAPAAGGAPAIGNQFRGPPAASPAQTDGVTNMIPPSIRQFVVDIKRQNPKATPDEILSALDEATPWMTAQQKLDMDALKQKLDIYKVQAGEADKDRTAKQRDQQLAISKKRADAYVKYLEGKPQGKQVSEKAKALNAKAAVYATAMSQIEKRNGGPPTQNSPDYPVYIQYQQAQLKVKQALSYLYNSVQAVPPPADIQDQLYQDQPDASGGDASGGP